MGKEKLMMTPKEKADEIFSKMIATDKVDSYSFVGNSVARECALIAVDEIIKSRPAITDSQVEHQIYWQEVKQELNKIL